MESMLIQPQKIYRSNATAVEEGIDVLGAESWKNSLCPGESGTKPFSQHYRSGDGLGGWRTIVVFASRRDGQVFHSREYTKVLSEIPLPRNLRTLVSMIVLYMVRCFCTYEEQLSWLPCCSSLASLGNLLRLKTQPPEKWGIRWPPTYGVSNIHFTECDWRAFHIKAFE